MHFGEIFSIHNPQLGYAPARQTPAHASKTLAIRSFNRGIPPRSHGVSIASGETGMLVVVLVGALALVLMLRSAKAFAFGALVVVFACVWQANAYSPIGFLNNLTDAALALATYVAIGLAIVFSAWLQRTMKGFSRS
jgi:hypothetical protein